MAEIDFNKIIAQEGKQTTGFEELCCQLARREEPQVVRIRGDGGDGGVECFVRLSDGPVIGWQAKFVFDFDSLLQQLKKSFTTAVNIYPTLTKYVVCFPFDLTGKTGRKGTNQTDKFDAWIKDRINEASDLGRTIAIEKWSAETIRGLLLKHDAAGGMRRYFFSDVVLSTDWFKQQIAIAIKMAGPRYTPALNVKTPLAEWFSSFGGGEYWTEKIEPFRKECATAIRHLGSQLEKHGGELSADWPADDATTGLAAIDLCRATLAKVENLRKVADEALFLDTINSLKSLVTKLRELDVKMSKDFDATHGEGQSDNKAFRRVMAEQMCAFPAGNLDSVRDAAIAFEGIQQWLKSPGGYLAFRKIFVLSGAGGSGKTHGICDVAQKRIEEGAYTCILFGHQFNGEPAFWTRLIESTGQPPTLSKEVFLGALSAAGEASGKPLVLVIDAINETRPRRYWIQWLAALCSEIEKWPFLKLCISCRTSFHAACLPNDHGYPLVEHQGFAGIERDACNAFFSYYGLEPPLIPILQPELSNPLYLKLICETLKLRGLRHLPSGWQGLAPVIRAFLAEKEKAFAHDTGTSSGAGMISASLLAIASAIAASGGFAVAWSEAEAAVAAKRPNSASLNVVDWLVKSELLIEDGPGRDRSESILRPAFDRFGDFLVAAELVAKLPAQSFADAFRADQTITSLCENPAANAGVLQALSVLVSENPGTELPDLVMPAVYDEILEISMRALPWRTPETFTARTCIVVRKALNNRPSETLDAVLAVSTQASAIDAQWMSSVLSRLELTQRDAVWSGYLHQGFEDNGIVRRLISAADDLELRKLEDDTALLWATMLLWFTAAADRRVKDTATRAIVALFRSKSVIIPQLLRDFLYCEDDEIRERVLLASYGALLISRDLKILKIVAENLLGEYADSAPNFEHALIRDHIRCIAELAHRLGCLDSKCDPLLTTKPSPGGWPLSLPSADQLQAWEKESGAMHSVVRSALNDDFNHYSIGCLSPWMHKMYKPAIGAWISGYVGNDLRLAFTTDCDNYDQYISYKNGGGRSKPAWAERIGKKYQWTALFKLASHLHDNVPPKIDKWNPKPVRTPLILVEERKIDPTLSQVVIPKAKAEECWWIRKTLNFAATKPLDGIAWTVKTDDVPTLDILLLPTSRNAQRWVPLSLHISDSDYDESSREKPYRHGWVATQAYLVSKEGFDKTIEALDGRNFFGGWLPDGGKWLHVFAGEYPWATSCNTEPDYYIGVDSGVRDTDLKFTSATNEVIVEWAYDGSLPESIHLEVPSKLLLPGNDYWWNGVDGYKDSSDKTVYFDPRIQNGGPSTLLADLDALTAQLNKMGVRLFWTMLGKKDHIGGNGKNEMPENIFSQVAFLNKDGTITARPCAFFDDERKDRVVRPRP